MAEKELAVCDECGSLFSKAPHKWWDCARNVLMFSMVTQIVPIVS